MSRQPHQHIPEIGERIVAVGFRRLDQAQDCGGAPPCRCPRARGRACGSCREQMQQLGKKSARVRSATTGLRHRPASATQTTTDPSLVGYRMFNDGAGSTAADSSGSGNIASLINSPTWVNGQIGGALNFDGISQSASVANIAGLSTGRRPAGHAPRFYRPRRTGRRGVDTHERPGV